MPCYRLHVHIYMYMYKMYMYLTARVGELNKGGLAAIAYEIKELFCGLFDQIYEDRHQ